MSCPPLEAAGPAGGFICGPIGLFSDPAFGGRLRGGTFTFNVLDGWIFSSCNERLPLYYLTEEVTVLPSFDPVDGKFGQYHGLSLILGSSADIRCS
jgi:hypothetical protein